MTIKTKRQKSDTVNGDVVSFVFLHDEWSLSYNGFFAAYDVETGGESLDVIGRSVGFDEEPWRL